MASTIYTLCGVLVASVGIYLAMRGGKLQDPYGDFHLALNVDPSRPRSEWLNMGYWEGTESFPQACEALALKLVQAAGCKEGGHVLDVGYGSGDSLLLQLSHPSAPRPSRLTGITSLSSHHERAQQRVVQLQTSSDAVEVQLLSGDAVYHPVDPSSGSHPLNPSTSNGRYTTILALDCAYHFRTRHAFLSQAFTGLSSGGRVALADICFASTPSPWLRRVLGGLGVMPQQNMVSKEEYVHDMEVIGYDDIIMEDISEQVFPGFTRFLKKRGLLWSGFAHALNWLVGRGARFVIVTGRKPTSSTVENKA